MTHHENLILYDNYNTKTFCKIHGLWTILSLNQNLSIIIDEEDLRGGSKCLITLISLPLFIRTDENLN